MSFQPDFWLQSQWIWFKCQGQKLLLTKELRKQGGIALPAQAPRVWNTWWRMGFVWVALTTFCDLIWRLFVLRVFGDHCDFLFHLSIYDAMRINIIITTRGSLQVFWAVLLSSIMSSILQLWYNYKRIPPSILSSIWAVLLSSIISSILQLRYNYKRIPPLLRTISIRPLLPLPQDAQVFSFLAFQFRCWLFSWDIAMIAVLCHSLGFLLPTVSLVELPCSR